jgi:hypothetical protein
VKETEEDDSEERLGRFLVHTLHCEAEAWLEEAQARQFQDVFYEKKRRLVVKENKELTKEQNRRSNLVLTLVIVSDLDHIILVLALFLARLLFFFVQLALAEMVLGKRAAKFNSEEKEERVKREESGPGFDSLYLQL